MFFDFFLPQGWAEPKEGEIVVSKFEKWSLLDGGMRIYIFFLLPLLSQTL